MTTSLSVKRTTGIGTTAVEVSPGGNARRSIANIGSTTLELCEKVGDAYGTGFPLPAGTAFTFDAGGSISGSIYVASSGAGGVAAVVSY